MSIEFLGQEPRLFHYPGGEPTVATDAESGRAVAVLRGADPDELLTVLMWANSLRRQGATPSLLVPYLPAARADHADHASGFDAQVYADVINTGRFEHVICADPHSEVMPSLVDRCSSVEVDELMAHATLPISPVGLVCPDRGARSRVARAAELLDVPVYHAEKHRDFATGRLSGFSCEPLPGDGDLLVVDDICDGGGTFLGLAEAVPQAAGRLHLWVTHGVFSGDARRLLDVYETVTTTDSHPGCRNIDATVVAVLPALLERYRSITGQGATS